MNTAALPSREHHAVAAAPRTAGDASDDCVIARFNAGMAGLSADQQRRLTQWLGEQLRSTKRFQVVLGGGAKTSRCGRLRRMHALLQLLEHLGIAAKRIVTDGDWSKPARMGALEDMPADTMWLRISHQSPAN